MSIYLNNLNSPFSLVVQYYINLCSLYFASLLFAKSLASNLIILFYHTRMVCAKCGWNTCMSRFSGKIIQRVYNNGRNHTKNSIRISHEPLINSCELQKAEKSQVVWKKIEIVILKFLQALWPTEYPLPPTTSYIW